MSVLSAPLSTGRIEELIGELKADYAACMCLGDLIEFGPTAELFMKPRKHGTEDCFAGRFG